MTYTPKHLNRWKLPDHYTGEHWPEWYVFLTQHRDSDVVDRSNFIVGLERLGSESETVRVIREGHWLVGWIEWLGIHESDDKALRLADSMRDKIENSYPILNEEHYSEMEWTEAEEFWASLPVSERVEYCRDAGISIFAARRDSIPEDPAGRLYERLTTN